MNNEFEKRVRAAAVAGWWTLLIAVGFVTLQWIIYLPALERPEEMTGARRKIRVISSGRSKPNWPPDWPGMR